MRLEAFATIHSVLVGASLIILATITPDKVSAAQRIERLCFTSSYQAVLLTNGKVYYGQIKKEVAGFVRLDNVYYLISHRDKGSGKMKSLLIKRGEEIHGPGYMYINRTHILFIEPVAANSKIGKLIAEARRKAKKARGRLLIEQLANKNQQV